MKRIVFFLSIFILVTSCKDNEVVTSAMSFNLRYDTKNDKENWWGYRKQELVEQIQFYNPDFLGIQEGLHHQVAYIDTLLTDYTFIGVARDDGKQRGEYTALFYNQQKFTLIKSGTFWLSETPEVPSKGWDAALPRTASYGVFKHKDSQKEITVINTHYDHLGEQARAFSSTLLLQKSKEISNNSPLVLMGDFNAKPDQQPIQILSEELDDGRLVSPTFSGPEGTFNAFQKEASLQDRIDYIFTKNLKILEFKHIDTKRKNGLWVSDHLAVFTKISF